MHITGLNPSLIGLKASCPSVITNLLPFLGSTDNQTLSGQKKAHNGKAEYTKQCISKEKGVFSPSRAKVSTGSRRKLFLALIKAAKVFVDCFCKVSRCLSSPVGTHSMGKIASFPQREIYFFRFFTKELTRSNKSYDSRFEQPS